METADRRRGDEGRSVQDDGGDHASRSLWTERVRTFSHHDPSPCQWFSRLANLGRRSIPRLILLYLGTVLARGRRTVLSKAAANGIAEDREAQPLAEHATAGDRPNRGAEHPGHGLASGRLALGSHASSGGGLHRTHSAPFKTGREL
jgi:hypothetical protein